MKLTGQGAMSEEEARAATEHAKKQAREHEKQIAKQNQARLRGSVDKRDYKTEALTKAIVDHNRGLFQRIE